MHILNLNIKNFRGIKSLEIDDLKMVNIFLGKNNVGKTSILEAIFISLAPGNPNIAIAIDNFRNLLHTNSDDFRLIFYQLNYDNTIEINSQYNYDELEKGLKITPIITNSVLLSAQQKDLRNNNDNLLSNNSANNRPVNGLNLNYSYKKRHTKNQVYVAKIELENNAFIQTPAKNAEFLRVLYATPNNLVNILSAQFDKVLINKQEQEIIDILKTVDNSIEGLFLGANNLLLVDTGFGKRFPINLLGEGTLKLLSILLAIYDTQNGVVLIDEFSNGLHYTALKCLWKAIFDAASKYKVQLFLTTHDYESLKHLKDVLEIEENHKYQSEVMGYTVRKLPNGNLKSYAYDFLKLETAINEDNEIR